MPLVSVVIPCFNAAPWIRETLRSVEIQEISDLEVVVVDDGSTDESSAIIKREFPQVNLIRTQNRGPSCARNTGTKAARGEFIQYLDADDLLAKEKIKIQLEALKNSGAEIAYGDWQVLVKNKKGEFILGKEIRRKMQHPDVDVFMDNWYPLHAYLFRRSIVERSGGWQEDLCFCEDVRFILDCVFQDASFIYCPGIMGYFRQQPKGESTSSRDAITFVRCCLKNAAFVENRWSQHEGLTGERKKVLLEVYDYIAWASFRKDPQTFYAADTAIKRIEPGHIPFKNKLLRWVYKRKGYKSAAQIAFFYRRPREFLFSFLHRSRWDHI